MKLPKLPNISLPDINIGNPFDSILNAVKGIELNFPKFSGKGGLGLGSFSLPDLSNAFPAIRLGAEISKGSLHFDMVAFDVGRAKFQSALENLIQQPAALNAVGTKSFGKDEVNRPDWINNGMRYGVYANIAGSILGDSGIGGYLAITGDDDFDQDKLERKLSGITGVNNNAVHNWQKWFDEKIQQKYDDDIELGYTVDDAERNITIQKEFAEDYVNSYLKPRFDESRSMSEFVEYLDVRQEEQNPFQTQDILNAVQQVGQSHAESYLDQLRSASDKGFDSTFYTDPTGKAGMNEAREADYTKQRDMVAADWDKAQNNPDELVDPLNPGLGTWREQIYRFGTDVTSADQFARLHYQIKGQHENYKFDGAEDIMSPGKVKEMIYTQIFPALQDEVARQPHVFGQFIRPEEFADDVLEGIDPNVPDSWESALTGSDGKSLIEGFTGSFDELKQYIVDGMSGNSALDMRQSIKYLNEKKERPTQELLGIDYIQRDEDYNPADQLKGDTQLYKIFQGAGYEGTEDDFYDKVFPDLDPSSQELLTQAGSKDGKITLGSWDDSDPYAALGSVETLLGDDFGSPTKKTTTDKKDKKSSVFSFDPFDDDDDDDDYKSAKGQEILSDFTKGFKFF